MKNTEKKARVAIYYESRLGRNDGFPVYAWNVLKNFEREGIIGEVVHLIPDGNYQNDGKFDLHVWIDWGEDALKGYLPYEPVWPTGKVAYFASDTHLGPEYRFMRAGMADHAFFGQKRGLEDYLKSDVPKKKGQTSEWMLHAVEETVYRPGVWTGEKWVDAVPQKDVDVCFIGHIQTEENCNGFTRLEFLDRMFKEFPNFYFGTRSPQSPTSNLFEDIAMKFNRSKVVLNITIKDDINMRTFEGLATKSLVLTNDIPTLHEIYEDGVDLVMYKTIDEAVEKAHYYINHPEEAARIAEAGYKKTCDNHTYRHRMLHILKTAGIIN